MVLAILIALVILNKILYKSYLNPIFLQSVLWLVYYFFLSQNIRSFNVGIEPLNKFVLLQSIGFSLGGFICLLFTRKSLINNKVEILYNETEKIQSNIIRLYPYFLCFLIFCIFFLIRMGKSFSLDQVFNLRDNEFIIGSILQ